jgi:hypothetical protein
MGGLEKRQTTRRTKAWFVKWGTFRLWWLCPYNAAMAMVHAHKLCSWVSLGAHQHLLCSADCWEHSIWRRLEHMWHHDMMTTMVFRLRSALKKKKKKINSILGWWIKGLGGFARLPETWVLAKLHIIG